MRRILDRLYQFSLWSSAAMIFVILVLIMLQMAGRLTGTLLPGTDDFAGYALVSSTFLGLAATLRAQGHIRVQILLQHLPERVAAWCEVICGAAGIGIVGFLTYSAFDFVRDSYLFHEVAGGLLPTPLWIVQTPMVLGLALLLIAMLEFLVDAIVVACRPGQIRAPQGTPVALSGE